MTLRYEIGQLMDRYIPRSGRMTDTAFCELQDCLVALFESRSTLRDLKRITEGAENQ
jgi:hypothetical protein